MLAICKCYINKGNSKTGLNFGIDTSPGNSTNDMNLFTSALFLPLVSPSSGYQYFVCCGLGGCGYNRRSINHAHSASSESIFLAHFSFLASFQVKDFQMSDEGDSDSGVSYH